MPLPIDPPDEQDRWAPTWLIDLTEAVGSSISTGGMDVGAFDLAAFDVLGDLAVPLVSYRFATRDLSTTPVPYHGRLLETPTIERHMTDVFWGMIETTEFSFSLTNGDGLLDVLLFSDARGKPVTLTRYDVLTNTTVQVFTATISQVLLDAGIARIVAVTPDVTKFEQQVPSKIVTVAEFGNQVVDVGAVVPVTLSGSAKKVLLPYVRDGVNTNHFDYVVGHGVVQVDQLYRDGPDGTMVPIEVTEYRISTTLYRNYTVVRFLIRQQDFSNAFHKIYADITGSAVTNFARAIQTILTNTTWGLGQAVDTASFDAAAAVLDAVGGLVCEGVLLEQVQAQDILRDLLLVRGMRLGVNSAGEWTIEVDTAKTSIAMRVGDGPGDGVRNLLRWQARSLTPISDAVSDFVLRYRFDPATNTYKNEQTRVIGLTGHQRVIENKYIRSHLTADKTVDYLAKRQKFGEDRSTFVLPQEARGLLEGDLLLVRFAPLRYDETTVEVIGLKKGLEEVEVDVALWDESIYTYTPGTLPTDEDENLDELRLPRVGGLELVGPATRAPKKNPGIVNISKLNFVGQANDNLFVGRDARFQWHHAIPLPHKGLDEDNLSNGIVNLRDYQIVFFGVVELKALKGNAAVIQGIILEKGEDAFPLTGRVLPFFKVRVSSAAAYDSVLPVYVPATPVTLTVWTEPADQVEIPVPDVGDPITATISLYGNNVNNAWVYQTFSPEFLTPLLPGI